jgi:hypothetical protein
VKHLKELNLIKLKNDKRYDVVIGEEAYKEYVDNGKKSRPFSELKGELNL